MKLPKSGGAIPMQHGTPPCRSVGRTPPGHKDNRERGAVLVEFAFIIPLLLLLILAVVEFGFRYERGTVLNNAAFIAARDMAIHHDAGQATTAATNAGAPAGSVSVGACNPGQNVVVTVTATVDSPTGAFGSTFTVHGKGVARCDKDS
jgi:Flp pilus assembly protein TadG